jgi:2,3-bisphosphoglycerate-dependent phosphoglycerate mutase
MAVDQRLVECAYGEWTGKSLRELSKDKLWSSVQQQPSAVRFPGGEAMSDMSARAIAAVRDWDARMEAERGPDAVWAAVSHGDVIKAILADALGMHLDSFQRILVDPASISIVRYTAARPYLITANSTTVDLAAFLSPPRKKPRSRRTRTSDDAVVGGGPGASEVADRAPGSTRALFWRLLARGDAATMCSQPIARLTYPVTHGDSGAPL